MWLRAICAAALALQVSVAGAEMSVDQQTAFAVLMPLAQDQLAAEPGLALAECMVMAAAAEEVAVIAAATGAEPSQKIIDLANEIIQRPLVLTCLTEKLS